MKYKKLWVTGRAYSDILVDPEKKWQGNWSLIGVFDDKEKAEASMEFETDFIGKIHMNKVTGDVLWEVAWRPFRELKRRSFLSRLLWHCPKAIIRHMMAGVGLRTAIEVGKETLRRWR